MSILVSLAIPLLAVPARAQEGGTAPEIAVLRSNLTSLVDGDATVAFEPLKLGSVGATQSLTIKNTGNATLSGLALTVDGEQASDFTVSALEVNTVAPGASRTFTITFNPSALGTRSAALHIASNDADENPFDIRLTGTGLAQEVTAPEIAVLRSNLTNLIDGDATVTFEPLKLGSVGATQSLTIKNTGNATLSGLALTVDGEQASDFTVSALEVNTVAPGASRTFTITFNPSAIGLRSAALHIASNDADENPFDIRLTGTGLAQEVTAPEIAVLRSNLTNLIDGDATVTFEPLKLGSVGATQSLTIKNTGNATLSGLALTVDGEQASDFTVSALEVNTVAPGASRTFTITFNPSAIGLRSAALHIASNDADENPFDIRLTGTGLAQEVTAPEIAVLRANLTNLIDGDATVTFEPLKLGSVGATQSLTIKNTGNATLSGLALTVDGEQASDFTVSALEVNTVAPGASRTFTVTFIPSALGTRSASLHIASNDADENPFDIRLTGTGLAQEVTAPEIAVLRSNGTNLIDGDATVAFEPLKLGSVGATQSLTIKNTGNATLSGLALTLDGEQASDFTVSSLEVNTVAPGASRTFTVTFKPSALGTRNAALHIASNDADENPFDIRLTGTGLEQEVTAPEIAVRKSEGVNLIDGDATVEFGVLNLSSVGATQSLTIRNTGNATLSGLSLVVDGEQASDFTVSSLEVNTVAPGASRTFTVTFNPSAIGLRSAALHIASNDADENPFDIRLIGTGEAAPEIEVRVAGRDPLKDEKAFINFGTVSSQSQGETRTFTITNRGAAKLTGLSLRKNGIHRDDFTVSPLKTTSLSPGRSISFKVTFSPSAGGNRWAAVHVGSNDPDTGSFDIGLTGKRPSAASAKSTAVSNLATTVSGSNMKTEETQSRPEVSTILIDGRKYRCITIRKTSGTTVNPGSVEVSADLVHWFSGPRHTTVVKNNASVLQVRDSTPLTRDTKRFIRVNRGGRTSK